MNVNREKAVELYVSQSEKFMKEGKSLEACIMVLCTVIAQHEIFLREQEEDKITRVGYPIP